ncbi:MAG TPA: DUF4783 domain-containing protein [Saprospiraceae bacterium]|nr:DUF4783 domain-containing protein [Saprospiraceae bacterium]
MKLIYNITASLFFILPMVGYSQSAGMDAAINKGSAADLGVFFAPSVDVSLLNSDATMSSAQAVQAMTDFFSQNMVKGYNRAHLTAPENGRASYSLGDLYTSTGNYRVYLYFDGQKRISEIRIQK